MITTSEDDLHPDDYYRAAMGLSSDQQAFDYQRQMLEAESPFEVIAVPTGCGKTGALIVSWLYRRRELGRGPRRLIYALPMRSLVEQTHQVALSIRKNLGLGPEDLEISMLIGGTPNRSWTEHPERDHIVVGTIDILLSRALNRGYAEGRFVWPVSFGLLNNDCHWVFDEVQLLGPALPTSLQLDGLREKLGTCLRCESTWASATVSPATMSSVDRALPTRILELPRADRDGALARRLNATKMLTREAIPIKEADRAVAIADLVRREHRPGTRTLVILNRVDRARRVSTELKKSLGPDAPRLTTIHSRFRPPDRARQTAEALDDAQLGEPGDPGTIVVTTQVIEAGVDTTSSLLITDLAPFESIVQRLGRCNRYGDDQGTAYWLDPEIADEKLAAEAAPYRASELIRARHALIDLDGESASPAVLENLDVPSEDVVHPTLRRADLLDIFDTAPDISGNDVDIARFIRDDDDRSIPVFFRAVEDPSARIDAAAPDRDEIVDVPIADLRNLLKGEPPRWAWTFDHIDGGWQRARGPDLVPGQPVMLRASEGGYDQLGWNPRAKGAVPVIAVATAEEPGGGGRQARTPSDVDESVGDDAASVSSSGFVSLSDHLDVVMEHASALTGAFGAVDATHGRAVVVAAGLHDLGKAHPTFQRVLRAVAGKKGVENADSLLLAKSPGRGPRYDRAHFRHELASALALHEKAVSQMEGIEALVVYLIAAHHGRVRMSIRPMPGERRPDGASESALFALGVADGDQCEAVDTPFGHYEFEPLSLEPMKLGASRTWTGMATGLRDDPDLGPFRLGFLEALVRIADWRGSAAD